VSIINKSWLGFDSRHGRLLAGGGIVALSEGLVAPGDTIMVSSVPQIPFRGERLFTWQATASAFLIHGLRIGNAEQTVGYGPIPADAFATRMDRLAEIEAIYKQHEVFELKIEKNAYEILGMEWPLPFVQGGTDMRFTVENVSDKPARFVAGLLGKIEHR